MLEVLKNLLALALSDEAMSVWVPWLGSALLTLIGAVIFKGKLDAKNKLFLAGLEVATAAMAKIAPGTANTVDDKIALALKALNDHFNEHGATLKPTDEAKAKALFLAMHGGK